MSAPVAASVILPDDSGNAGKKIRTQSRSVGGNTVHEHFFVETRRAEILGVYTLAMAQITALASAENGTSSGSLWFHVPSAITNKKVRLRSLRYASQHSSALATPTAPRLACSRMTFTGTASGASLTPVKVDATYPSPVADLRTAVTGLTVSLVGVMGVLPYCQALTAVGSQAPTVIDVISDDEDGWWMFAPGEGLAIWQDVAGTTSDTRKMNVQLLWDEIDTA